MKRACREDAVFDRRVDSDWCSCRLLGPCQKKLAIPTPPKGQQAMIDDVKRRGGDCGGGDPGKLGK